MITRTPDFSLLHHNTFGIDARCREFVEYDTEDDLLALLPELRGTKYFHIGGGSNLVFLGDYSGTVLHSRIKGFKPLAPAADGSLRVRIGAGEVWDEAVDYLVEHGYYGAENLSYIPGETGAAAVQNIGAYGAEVADIIESVETLRVSDGERVTFLKEQCAYAYRQSIFKGAARGQYIVTRVTLRLQPVFSPSIGYGAIGHEVERRGIDLPALTARELRNIIIDIRRSKLPEPSEVGSAGSFFMNPVVPRPQFEALQQQYPDMPHYDAPGGVKIPAGWMIEQCGWKGRTVGHVGVYDKQALVLINAGGATGREVFNLAQTIAADVQAKFGIEITPEANFVE